MPPEPTASPTAPPSDTGARTVLVAGATGYIGGRLVPELLDAGHHVRCLARTPAKLRDRPWADRVEVHRGDVLAPEGLGTALEGVDVVYYLVHSMDGEGDFRARDRRAAENVRRAATDAGVEQIVYLGGLGDSDDDLSEHLRSRQEVGRVLADGPVPVTELRAAVIIGSGSASFEMLRHLTEVLPVMVTPRWVNTHCQPIAVRDVLAYLVGVLGREEAKGRVLEVGGPDVLTYVEMMQLYAEAAGLRRRVVLDVPLLTPGLSSRWIGLVTPLPVGLARPLVDSLVNEVVVHDDAIRSIVPREPLPIREAIRLALRRIQDVDVTTTWAGADLPESVTGRPRTRLDAAEPAPTDPAWSGGTVLSDDQDLDTQASPEAVFATLEGLGGDRGWYSPLVLWRLRGWLDALVGGIGMRRGRRHPDRLGVGEPVDFWRVELLDRPTRLRLHAEMRLPGEAWLDFRVTPRDDGGSRMEQHARFAPRGLWGRIYWYGMLPFHGVIFPRMARAIVAAAEQREERQAGDADPTVTGDEQDARPA
jgi:uncharacterized protein YbjT (DUF2867 family)